MRNRTGQPVEGADFFERPHDLDILRRELANGANLLLSAPRRVGKTSLVLRLCEDRRKVGWAATFLNVEHHSDELALVEGLIDGLRLARLHPDGLTRLGHAIRNARRAIGSLKVGLGIDIELGPVDGENASTLEHAVESTFERIDSGDADVLIAIDELPEVLRRVSAQEDGAGRTGRLLHWLRALRQTYRRRIRWVFLGSIGLDSFVADRLLGKTLNDLTIFEITSPTAEEADAFLERLAADNDVTLTPGGRRRIVEITGWPLFHHMQLMFHALWSSKDQGPENPAGAGDVAAVDAAFESLLSPQQIGQFDTWRQRLDEALASVDASAARTILRQLCQSREGRSRDQLFNALMAVNAQADPATIEVRLANLLVLLQRDGYLAQADGRYAFRSFLLREVWYRREIR